jgi:hypothetical protein
VVEWGRTLFKERHDVTTFIVESPVRRFSQLTTQHQVTPRVGIEFSEECDYSGSKIQ